MLTWIAHLGVRRWRRLAGVSSLCVLALFVCLQVPAQERQVPATGIERSLPGGEANGPLLEGQERVNYKLTPRFPKGPLVILAISGGGSRSAYYAACAMEHLATIENPCGPGSVLDTVRVISCVSAGAIAAAWYSVHYDERYQQGFFARFKEAMSVNLQWRAYGHMILFPPLALQLLGPGVTRTDLLANQIRKIVTGGENMTFDDLRQREMRAQDPAPTLIINGTVYNSGQRIVMTNLPPSRFPSVLDTGGSRFGASDTQRQVMYSLVQPLTFEDIGSNIGSFRVSQAVAASAAFPILLAPFRLRVYPDHVPPRLYGRASGDLLQSHSIYVADGGVIENEGVDSVLSLLKTLPRNQPVLVLIVDASQRMQTMRTGSHKIFDPGTIIWRMYDIGTMRPLATYGAQASRFHNPNKLGAVMIHMEGADDKMRERVLKIPTSLKLSRANRKTLDKAAEYDVGERKKDIIEAFKRLGRN